MPHIELPNKGPKKVFIKGKRPSDYSHEDFNQKPASSPFTEYQNINELSVSPKSQALASETPTSQALISKTPASQTLTSETPASQTLTSETPASQTLTSEAPASQTLTSETPASQTSTSETPASQTSTSETPASQTLISKTPVSKTLPSETPTSQTLELAKKNSTIKKDRDLEYLFLSWLSSSRYSMNERKTLEYLFKNILNGNDPIPLSHSEATRELKLSTNGWKMILKNLTTDKILVSSFEECKKREGKHGGRKMLMHTIDLAAVTSIATISKK